MIFSRVSFFSFALYVSNNIFKCLFARAICNMVVVFPLPATESTNTFASHRLWIIASCSGEHAGRHDLGWVTGMGWFAVHGAHSFVGLFANCINRLHRAHKLSAINWPCVHARGHVYVITFRVRGVLVFMGIVVIVSVDTSPAMHMGQSVLLCGALLDRMPWMGIEMGIVMDMVHRQSQPTVSSPPRGPYVRYASSLTVPHRSHCWHSVHSHVLLHRIGLGICVRDYLGQQSAHIQIKPMRMSTVDTMINHISYHRSDDGFVWGLCGLAVKCIACSRSGN